MNTVYVEMEYLKNQFAIKNENGQVEYHENGNFSVPIEKIAEYQTEMDKFENEFLEIETNAQNKDMLLTVANILLTNENLQLSGDLAYIHDELCMEFEKTLELYNEK